MNETTKKNTIKKKLGMRMLAEKNVALPSPTLLISGLQHFPRSSCIFLLFSEDSLSSSLILFKFLEEAVCKSPHSLSKL